MFKRDVKIVFNTSRGDKFLILIPEFYVVINIVTLLCAIFGIIAGFASKSFDLTLIGFLLLGVSLFMYPAGLLIQARRGKFEQLTREAE